MNKKILINKQEYNFELTESSNSSLTLEVDGESHCFEIYSQTDNQLVLKDTSGKLYTFLLSKETIHYQSKEFEIEKASHYSKENSTSSLQNSLASPLPGRVISIEVSEGETILKGETVAIIEAMKMEHRIIANTSGRILKINTKVGESISEGFIIGEIDEQRD